MHRQLADLAEQLAAGPRAVAARTRQVQAADAKKAAAADDVKKAKVVADQKQLQLKSAETKIADLEGKLNACKTNREYQTLGDQIAADRMATKVLEDEILEALERIDVLKPAVPAAEKEIEAAKKLLAGILHHLRNYAPFDVLAVKSNPQQKPTAFDHLKDVFKLVATVGVF